MAVKTVRVVDPFSGGTPRHEAGVFGMWLFLATLAVLFLTTMLGYLVVRLNPDPVEPFRPEASPGLPHLLLASTAALLASSATMHATVRGVRSGHRAEAARWAGLTLALAILFLAVQAWAWLDLWRQQLRIDESLYAWTFYVLTGLHAAHVLGGLVPLWMVWRRIGTGRYSPRHPEGVVYCAMYWHFLDAVWLALYATLWLGSLTWSAGS
jgi:heme/copper-type cytochrome/quinol oxidase subunit 3